MRTFLTLLYLLSLILINEARWKLKWTDEFDQYVFDNENWEIDEQDNKKCDQQNIRRLNCYTNSSRNLRLIDGTLSLVAIYEKRLNKKFTSAWIKTKKNFTYGRIDIRASLPVAKLLSPWFKLVNPKLKNRDGGVRNNQVVVFFNDGSNWLKYGYSVGKRLGNVNEYLTDGALYEFHTYSVEWNETDLIWRFDGKQTNWINLTNANTFLTNEVILISYLRVGGNPFREASITVEDVYEWECSLFTLDYIRYYQWSDEKVLHSNVTKHEDRSSVNFCKSIMDETKPKREDHGVNNLNITAIISAASLSLLLALIPLIGWLVIRMRKVRDPARKVEDMDNYYDDINNMEMYEDANKDNNYDYAVYQTNHKKNYYSEPERYALPVYNDLDNDYITMTSKTKKPHEYTLIHS